MSTTMVKEKTIGFNGAMVRAILRDGKTQTRRPMKPQPELRGNDWFWPHKVMGAFHCAHGDRPSVFAPWQPGDLLRISEEVLVTPSARIGYYMLTFAADGFVEHRQGTTELLAKISLYKKPRLRGVSLPPEYARKDRLEITDVRVERLNEITPDDAKAEGVEDFARTHNLGGYWTTAFARLWESINGNECKRCKGQGVIIGWSGCSDGSCVQQEADDCPACKCTGHAPTSWAANPFVWAISFKRIS